MGQRNTDRKTRLLCAAALLAVAAAAFTAMDAFTRPVFGGIWQWQLSFAALAAVLLLSAAFRLPALTLGAAAVSGAAMAFITPFYGALFLPFALTAAANDAARSDAAGHKALFAISLAGEAALVPLHVRLHRDLLLNGASYGGAEPKGEAYFCLAGTAALAALWGFLFVRSVAALRAQKKAAAKRGRHKNARRAPEKKQKDAELTALSAAVYLLAAVNTGASLLHLPLLFSGEFAKTAFFAAAAGALALLWGSSALKRAAERLVRFAAYRTPEP